MDKSISERANSCLNLNETCHNEKDYIPNANFEKLKTQIMQHIHNVTPQTQRFILERAVHYYFLLSISRESIVFGSNFRSGGFGGFTRFEVP